MVITAENFNEIGRNPQRISNLTKFTDNNYWSGLKFPIAIKDINIFEMDNDISINKLLVKNKDIYIRRDHEINLLLISEDDKLH